MKIPTIREVVGFKYSQLVHLVLLLTFFSVYLADLIIGSINKVFIIDTIIIIIIPLLAILFCCIRPQQCLDKCDRFPLVSVIVEFVLYVICLVYSALALCGICFWLITFEQVVARWHEMRDQYPSIPKPMRSLLVVKFVFVLFEFPIEALGVYKLLPSMLDLCCGSPEQKESTLQELKRKIDCKCFRASASASEHVELAGASA